MDIAIVSVFDVFLILDEDDTDGVDNGNASQSQVTWIFGSSLGVGGARCISDTSIVWTKRKSNNDSITHNYESRNVMEGELAGTLIVSFPKNKDYEFMWKQATDVTNYHFSYTVPSFVFSNRFMMNQSIA